MCLGEFSHQLVRLIDEKATNQKSTEDNSWTCCSRFEWRLGFKLKYSCFVASIFHSAQSFPNYTQSCFECAVDKCAAGTYKGMLNHTLKTEPRLTSGRKRSTRVWTRSLHAQAGFTICRSSTRIATGAFSTGDVDVEDPNQQKFIDIQYCITDHNAVGYISCQEELRPLQVWYSICRCIVQH